MDAKDLLEIIELEDKYKKIHQKEKYEIFPRYWFSIEKLDFRKKMLKKAIEEKKLLFDLEEMNVFHQTFLEETYIDNIDKNLNIH